MIKHIVALLLMSVSSVSLADQRTSDTHKNYFLIQPEGGFGGLSAQGLATLKQQIRDPIRAMHASLNQELRHSQAAIHAALVARLLKGHMFIYGPQGGAKSKLARSALAFERQAPFKLQLHQAMTDQPLVGGQDFEVAKRGEIEINTKGSLATFKTAILDELDKASPGVLSVLLGIMNEREVQVGKMVFPADTQTIFATSNAILPEIFDAFRENGQLSTAAALLNRFQFKVCQYNWLPDVDQEALSNSKFKDLLEEALQFERGSVCAPKSGNSTFIDWDTARKFALYLVRFSPDALKAYTQMVNRMRAATNRELEASRVRNAEDPDTEPFVYFPTADYSERLRQVVPEVVMYSAFIDFLLSPLADDAVLDIGFLSQPMELQPTSLWRAYLMLTTVFSGDVKLQNADGKFFVQFSNQVDRSKLRDNRERGLVKMIEKEQARFKQQYLNIANFKCTKALSTKWLNPERRDLEELLQPNPTSDKLRREAFKVYVPCEDEVAKPKK